MVGAGYEVGEKVDHYHALLLSLKNNNYRLLYKEIDAIFLQLKKINGRYLTQWFLSVLSNPY
jgi:hypothetical protein